MTQQTLLEHIKYPFTLVKDSNGYIYNSSTAVIKCIKGHIHRYYISDIIHGATMTCPTCSSGNLFTTIARETLEAALGSPFVLSNTNTTFEKNTTEYINPQLKLTIALVNRPGTNTITSDKINDKPDHLLITIHRTNSAKKILNSIYSLLTTFAQSSQSSHVYELLSKLNQHYKSSQPNKKNIHFDKDKLPLTSNMIANITARNRSDALSTFVEMQLNICDSDQLLIENSIAHY